MELPIKLKYFTIERGDVQKSKADDADIPGYVLIDNQGVVVASGTGLSGIFEHGLGLDVQYELMSQFVARGNLDRCKHLEDVDCDDTGPVGLALPGLGGLGGGGGPFLQ